MSKKQIEECIRTSLEAYFKDLRGTEPDNMHGMTVSYTHLTLPTILRV